MTSSGPVKPRKSLSPFTSAVVRAFVALYDATDDRTWIAPGEQAALFIETWIYAWAVPLNKNDAKAIYQASRSTLGVSLTTSGQSGADNFMAEAVYDFGGSTHSPATTTTGDTRYSCKTRPSR